MPQQILLALVSLGLLLGSTIALAVSSDIFPDWDGLTATSYDLVALPLRGSDEATAQELAVQYLGQRCARVEAFAWTEAGDEYFPPWPEQDLVSEIDEHHGGVVYELASLGGYIARSADRTILVYWASQSEFNVPLGELPKELASVPNSVVAFICSTQAG